MTKPTYRSTRGTELGKEVEMEKFINEKRCCSVCDAKKKCHVCGTQTLLACSDCQIDLGATVYVCSNSKCRNAHDLKCPGRSTPEQVKVSVEEMAEVIRNTKSKKGNYLPTSIDIAESVHKLISGEKE